MLLISPRQVGLGRVKLLRGGEVAKPGQGLGSAAANRFGGQHEPAVARVVGTGLRVEQKG